MSNGTKKENAHSHKVVRLGGKEKRIHCTGGKGRSAFKEVPPLLPTKSARSILKYLRY